MAFYDWNKDGKKDVQDDFIEYNIYKQSTENNGKNNYNNSGSISNIGAGCATVISIFIAAGILSIFNLEGTALVIAFIIVVSIVAAVVSNFFE